jgi:hypothetical protein
MYGIDPGQLRIGRLFDRMPNQPLFVGTVVSVK